MKKSVRMVLLTLVVSAAVLALESDASAGWLFGRRHNNCCNPYCNSGGGCSTCSTCNSCVACNSCNSCNSCNGCYHAHWFRGNNCCNYACNSRGSYNPCGGFGIVQAAYGQPPSDCDPNGYCSNGDCCFCWTNGVLQQCSANAGMCPCANQCDACLQFRGAGTNRAPSRIRLILLASPPSDDGKLHPMYIDDSGTLQIKKDGDEHIPYGRFKMHYAGAKIDTQFMR